MPTIRRLYAIVDTSVVDTADSRAAEWDLAGDGGSTFSNGAALSDDGGASITHRAMNCLDNPDEGSIVDRSVLWDALANTPLFDVYGCDDRLGDGTVYRTSNGGWVEIGTGDLETVALADAGLEKYEAEPL